MEHHFRTLRESRAEGNGPKYQQRIEVCHSRLNDLEEYIFWLQDTWACRGYENVQAFIAYRSDLE
jgi:hypothetical protein